MKDFSVRWTGFLTPSESGNYQIGLNGSMNRLWLDGQLLVDDPVLHDPIPSMKTVVLEKGRRYAVKIDYLRGGFRTKLVWLKIIRGPGRRGCRCGPASRCSGRGSGHHFRNWKAKK